MLKDFSGFEPIPIPAPSFSPRNGQWVLLKLKDIKQQSTFVDGGAYQTPDGFLCGVYVAAHNTPVTTEKGIVCGGDRVPTMIILVDVHGNNFAVGSRDPLSGHIAVSNVFFYPESSGIAELRDAHGDLNNLPPGRVFNSKWLDAFHTNPPIVDDIHTKHKNEMTPTTYLSEMTHDNITAGNPVL